MARRSCDSRLDDMEQKLESIKAFLKLLVSDEEQEAIDQKELLPGTAISVPICPACFGERKEYFGNTRFYRFHDVASGVGG